jgi:hypothetical protein
VVFTNATMRSRQTSTHWRVELLGRQTVVPF